MHACMHECMCAGTCVFMGKVDYLQCYIAVAKTV
jgi:hypothetical protein